MTASSSSSTGTRRFFPGDAAQDPTAARDTSRRLSVCSLTLAGVLAVNLVIYDVVPALGGPNLGTPFSLVDVFVILAALLSIGVFLVSRSAKLHRKQLLDLGLGYELLLAAVLSAAFHLTPDPPLIPENGVSWLCVLILIFPVIVPNTPLKTAVVSLIVASLDPLGAFLSPIAGHPPPAFGKVFEAYYANYVCAALAIVPALVIERLGREIRSAREMGSYRLIELMGKGGMGEVWRASHHLLAREAAIKIIQPEKLSADPGDVDLALKRFEQEAQSTATLQSPHTVELYDFGIAADRTFFYVMELLDGVDLQTLVQKFGPLPPERVRHLLVQICHSLADAHERGLVHRDIKPANIFVCRKGRDCDYVKVLDFGLVKRQWGDGADALMTSDKVLVGTPAFMAPEMILGQAIDGRTDIYSLGCVAYWLMAGRLPFEGGSSMDVLMRQINTPPEPPSARRPEGASPGLERIVLACMAKEPGKRPASAEELASTLEALRLAEPWTKTHARAWWEAHIIAPGGDSAGPLASQLPTL